MFLRDSDAGLGGPKEKCVARNRRLVDVVYNVQKKLNLPRNFSEHQQFIFSDNCGPLRYAYFSSIIDTRELMVSK